jgi:hypothetical protein
MRRFLLVLGTLTLVFIVVAVIGIGVLFYKGSALDAESKAFVDRAVPAIVGKWDKNQLLELASPELQQKVRPDELNALFTSLSRLGHLVEYVGATGDARMSYNLGSGGTLTASYLARARFENGAAMIRLNLIKRDGDWMINYFYVDTAPGERKTDDI